MKTVLISLLVLIGLTVCAQSKTPSVTEYDNKDTYAFTVRLDKDQTNELIACYNAVAENTANIKARGDFSVDTEDGVRYTIDTGKRTIRVRNVEHSAQSAAAAKAVADRVRQQLGVQALRDTN